MNRPLTEIVAEMRARATEATPGPWFTTGSPWFRTGSGVLAGSLDPHQAFMVADCETFEGEREEYIESDGRVKIASGDADAAHIAASCPSNVIALADGFDERGREIERLGGERDDLDQVINDREGEIKRLTQERDEARAINSEYLATPVGQYIARATAAEARVKELEDALRPFADAADLFFEGDEHLVVSGTNFSIGDLRCAARLLSGGVDA